MDQQPDSPPAFAPVRLRYRRDGWTPERQRAFIAALWEERCALAACRRVGMSPEAAYKLHRHADAAGFRAAWQAAYARPRPPRPPRPATRERLSLASTSFTSSTSAGG